MIPRRGRRCKSSKEETPSTSVLSERGVGGEGDGRRKGFSRLRVEGEEDGTEEKVGDVEESKGVEDK